MSGKLEVEGATQPRKMSKAAFAMSPNEEAPMESPTFSKRELVPQKSTNTISSFGGKNAAKELNESIGTILLDMKYSFLALICVTLTFVLVSELSDGIIWSLLANQFQEAAGDFVLIWYFFVFILNTAALNNGLSIFFANKLTQDKGYSIAVVGWFHASFLTKLNFVSRLSLRSICRKVVNGVGKIYLLHLLSMIAALFSSLELYNELLDAGSGFAACLVYLPEETPFDRGWPTPAVQMGVAEYVFGKSLGTVRSQEAVDFTSFAIGPQVLQSETTGATIVGGGFANDIFTTCSCKKISTTAEIEAIGASSAHAAEMLPMVNFIAGSPGLVNTKISENESFTIVSILSGTNICGGFNITGLLFPVCNTTFSNPSKIIADVNYIVYDSKDPLSADYLGETHRSPARVAAGITTVIEKTENVSIASLEFAWDAFLKFPSLLPLPPTFPGAVNPLLWWATPNMQLVSAPALEAGLETTFSILQQGAIRRSFQTRGEFCDRESISQNIIKLMMFSDGVTAGLVFCVIQALLTFLSILCYIPWLRAKRPISPAVHLIRNYHYYTTMMNRPDCIGMVYDLNLATDENYFWLKADTVLKIGESVETIGDSEYGQIVLRQPRMVKPLSYEKKYE